MVVKQNPSQFSPCAEIAAEEEGRSLISIANGGRGFLEENLIGSPKAEARAGVAVE
jgi:hypothetical protein